MQWDEEVFGLELDLDMRRKTHVGAAILPIGLDIGDSGDKYGRLAGLELLLDDADQPDRFEQIEARRGRRTLDLDLPVGVEQAANGDAQVAADRLAKRQQGAYGLEGNGRLLETPIESQTLVGYFVRARPAPAVHVVIHREPIRPLKEAIREH